VDPGDIFANHSDSKELHPGEHGDGHNGGSVSGNGNVGDKGLDEKIKSEDMRLLFHIIMNQEH